MIRTLVAFIIGLVLGWIWCFLDGVWASKSTNGVNRYDQSLDALVASPDPAA